jgi:hypothetical protein
MFTCPGYQVGMTKKIDTAASELIQAVKSTLSCRV